jgi:hypothetical protein
VFKIIQLRAEKNNVRPVDWMQRIQALKLSGKGSDELEKQTKCLPGTPDYNNAILEDLVVPLHQQIIDRAILPFKNICDCLVLVKVSFLQILASIRTDTSLLGVAHATRSSTFSERTRLPLCNFVGCFSCTNETLDNTCNPVIIVSSSSVISLRN